MRLRTPHVVLVLAGLLAAGAQPAHGDIYFDEQFTGTGLDHLEWWDQAGTISNGVASFPGTSEWGRRYLRTQDDAYNTRDFAARAIVTLQNFNKGIGFFGIGTGNPNPNFYDEPTVGIFLRLWPDQSNASGNVDVVDQLPTGNPGGATVANMAGTGTHAVQLQWDAALQTATFSVDRNYTAGSLFVADYSYTAYGANNSFSSTSTRIFVGGAGGMTVDSFVVWNPIPEPATLGLLAVGALLSPASGLRSRRRASRAAA